MNLRLVFLLSMIAVLSLAAGCRTGRAGAAQSNRADREEGNVLAIGLATHTDGRQP